MLGNVKIIQYSHMHTGSTVLVNILQGFICNTDKIIFGRKINDDVLKNNYLIKTHCCDIDKIIEKYKDKYDLYFILSERYHLHNPKLHSYKNVKIIKYETLLETENYSVEDIIESVYNILRPFLPESITLNKQDAINRIKSMNELYEKIKTLPMSYFDPFYHIHGSHRNRKPIPINKLT